MNLTTHQHQVLNDAIAFWGQESQIAMAIGEIGELLTLFGRAAQGRDDDDQWRDEIADVLITVMQMAKIYGESEVWGRVALKIARLESKLHAQKESV